ncbi:DUF3108 domain-containing protein [Hydrogenophaga sp.]|uniref:DUF3108 domain-containing protein n=1 Tax=Hydrogenophaga sp. TaxID=1904254 RepID=UPI002BDE4351|nr:DUF3108 domain-containing protein [Hydrogenophaga sp.]HMP12150.1 DUF3108 domain-containing protein [Hydrogenophaga sp.]
MALAAALMGPGWPGVQAGTPEPGQVGRPAPAQVSVPDRPDAVTSQLPEWRTRGLPAALPPDSARLLYDVTGQSGRARYQASGALVWDRRGSAYDAQMRISAFLVGSRTQRSSGRLDSTGLHPDQFVDTSRREREVRFDSASARITYSENARQDVLLPGAQDRLSVLLQLASLLNARPPVQGQRFQMQVVGASDAEAWEFEVVGLEQPTVPAGRMPAWHLQRVARHPNDTRLSVWLAPQLQHLPVRLSLRHANGDQVEQSLRRHP